MTIDNTIISKECDKGCVCIIINAQFYKETMYDNLWDQNKTKRLIEKLTEKYKESLPKMEIIYLTGFQPNPSNLNGLPKIHKCKSISNENKWKQCETLKLENPEGLPFRPIVAGTNCVKSRLSHCIDIIVKLKSKML